MLQRRCALEATHQRQSSPNTKCNFLLSCCSGRATRWPCAVAQRQGRRSVQAPASTPAPLVLARLAAPVKSRPRPKRALTLQSTGHPTAGFAHCRLPVTSNVSQHKKHSGMACSAVSVWFCAPTRRVHARPWPAPWSPASRSATPEIAQLVYNRFPFIGPRGAGCLVRSAKVLANPSIEGTVKGLRPSPAPHVKR